ncbi:MAG: hypothetical protein IMF14_05235 [Proteobacteria bacterium]|nr:hypothetical protein [Pseudomonadota bacterium]
MNNCLSSRILRLPHLFLYLLLAFANQAMGAQQATGQASLQTQIRELEQDFKSLSTWFYRDASSYTAISQHSIDDIDRLLAQVQQLEKEDQTTSAIQLMYFNKETIKNNLDHKSVFVFTEILLENNEWNLADTLYRFVYEEGDKSLLPTIQFIFAKYHAERHEWTQVHEVLENIISELSKNDAAYGYLLNGTALQHMKKHRLAVDNYKKVAKDSDYYIYAQLDSAIAHIRQGWWTDAHSTITEILETSGKDNSDELINRLYLVLGYAMLHKEYYRDARDAFRHIALDSRYTNRALLGIGLTATSQGDLVGGLNALTILKNKKTSDLSVDESYLLVPYIYEKLQQEMTVSSSYTEAMDYFQKRIREMDKLTAQHHDFSNADYERATASFVLANNSFDYGRKYPESFINNYRQLITFSATVKDKKLSDEIERLSKRHDVVFQLIIDDLIAQRKKYLRSYLSQAQYGLARLYDNSNEADGQ